MIRLVNRSVLVAAVVAMAGVARADQITYTDQAIASGSLGGTTFSDALVTVSFTGDTSNVFDDGGILRNLIGTGTVTVAGIGTVAFTDSIQAFVNQGDDFVGIADTTLGPVSILDTDTNPAWETYDLKSAIGPLSGAPFINPGQAFGTASGSFILNSVSGDSTFTAAIGGQTVPEPSTLALSGIAAFVGLGMWMRRRKNA
jgi:hypothetical protein